MPRKMTHEEHVKAIAKVNHNVEVLGEITGNMEKYYVAARFAVMSGRLYPPTLKAVAVARNVQKLVSYHMNTENFTSWLTIQSCQLK